MSSGKRSEGTLPPSRLPIDSAIARLVRVAPDTPSTEVRLAASVQRTLCHDFRNLSSRSIRATCSTVSRLHRIFRPMMRSPFIEGDQDIGRARESDDSVRLWRGLNHKAKCQVSSVQNLLSSPVGIKQSAFDSIGKELPAKPLR